MKVMKLFTRLDLRLFDGDGGGAAAAAPAQGAPAAPGVPDIKKKAPDQPVVKYGRQPEEAAAPAAKAEPETVVTTDVAEARKAEFERLISSEYKDLFSERTQQIIDSRFKQTKQLEAQTKALSPVLELLGAKYGVDPSDPEALAKAVEEDSSYYEDEAMERGLTVEQLKHIKKLERENAEFARAAEEEQRRIGSEQIFQQWMQQAEATKQQFPNFDFDAEMGDPALRDRYLGLLKAGIDVTTAYKVIHQDDILGGAMAYTAQQIQQKTVADIRARGMRPSENGMAAVPAVIVKSDVTKFTRKDRDEIARRSASGEIITL